MDGAFAFMIVVKLKSPSDFIDSVFYHSNFFGHD